MTGVGHGPHCGPRAPSEHRQPLGGMSVAERRRAAHPWRCQAATAGRDAGGTDLSAGNELAGRQRRGRPHDQVEDEVEDEVAGGETWT